MKTIKRYFGSATLMAATILGVASIAFSCVRSHDIPGSEMEDGYGMLQLPTADITVIEDVRDKNHGVTRAAATRAVSTDNFTMTIKRIGNDEATLYDHVRYADFAAGGPLSLMVGSYTLYVESDAIKTAEFDYVHYSATERFDIRNGEVTAMEGITCRVTNMLVSVRFETDMVNIMDTPNTANIKISFGDNADASLNYGVTETRRGGFAPGAEKNVLRWDFSGTLLNGVDCSDSGFIPDVKAGEHRVLTFRVITDGEGGKSFGLSVDVQCETYDINKNIVIDQEQIIAPLIKPTTFTSNRDLTRRQSINLLDLPEELWINLEAETGISSVLVGVKTNWSNIHNSLPTDLKDGGKVELTTLILSPNTGYSSGNSGYFNRRFVWPVSTNLLGKKDVRFNFIPYLKDYCDGFFGALGYFPAEGCYIEVEITATDNCETPVTKTVSMNMDLTRQDPAASVLEVIGADGYTIDTVETVGITEKATKNVNIEVNATEGIDQFWVEITSSTHPAFEGLVASMAFGGSNRIDLANIESNDVATNLAGLGLPLRDQIKGKTNFKFGVNPEFFDLLFGVINPLPGDVQFAITVVDGANATANGSIKLHLIDDEI